MRRLDSKRVLVLLGFMALALSVAMAGGFAVAIDVIARSMLRRVGAKLSTTSPSITVVVP